jgi:hypothetical protein
MQYKFKIAKNKKDESGNKLNIHVNRKKWQFAQAYIFDNIEVSTISMSLDIGSVDGTKVIYLTCTRSTLIFPPETNKNCTMTETQNTSHKYGKTKYFALRHEIKTNKVAL